MLQLGEGPRPVYFEYDDHGKKKRFRFVKSRGGFITGYDEERKKRVELDDWCYSYYGGQCVMADLKTLYYDVGAPELIGATYIPPENG